jgi:hypothetical protein
MSIRERLAAALSPEAPPAPEPTGIRAHLRKAAAIAGAHFDAARTQAVDTAKRLAPEIVKRAIPGGHDPFGRYKVTVHGRSSTEKVAITPELDRAARLAGGATHTSGVHDHEYDSGFAAHYYFHKREHAHNFAQAAVQELGHHKATVKDTRWTDEAVVNRIAQFLEGKSAGYTATLFRGTNDKDDTGSIPDHPQDGFAHWMTDDRYTAGLYAHLHAPAGSKERVIRTKVTLKKPYRMDHDSYDAIRGPANASKRDALRSRLLAAGHDGIVVPAEHTVLGRSTVRSPEVVAAFHGSSVQHLGVAEAGPTVHESDLTPGRRYTHAEMIQHGADGYLKHAVLQRIPVHQIGGREPKPTNADSPDGKYTPGRAVTQPVEVEKHADGYTLYSGNHRVAQAEENGDTHILAFVHHPDGKYESVDDRVTEADNKKFSKTVKNAKTGRERTVRYGEKGSEIRPGTAKGDARG